MAPACSGLKHKMRTIPVIIAVFISVSVSGTQGFGTYTAINNCSSQISVFQQVENNTAPLTPVLSVFVVAAGARQVLSTGTTISTKNSSVVLRYVWGSPHGNANRSQCTESVIVDFPTTGTIYLADAPTAYNIGVEVHPTFFANGSAIAASQCKTNTCSISNIQSVCKEGNYFAGSDNACIAGSTNGTQLLKNACSETGAICDLNASFDFTFCPNQLGLPKFYDNLLSS